MSTRTRKFGPERIFIQARSAHFPAQFSNTPNARMPPPRCPCAARPINACCSKRLPLVLDIEGAIATRAVGERAGRRGGRIVICQRRKHHHHSRCLPQTSPIPTPQGFFINGLFIAARSMNVRSPLLVRHHHSHGLPQTAPIPMPPRLFHQRFLLHRRALFGRMKPFVSAAGPVAVALDT